MKNEQQYLVGELATATGLTVRTLQHYDNIGLLPSSGRTQGGRRYYTREDLIRLEQITFYKSIGMGLSEIKKRLSGDVSLEALERTLLEHRSMLTHKIESLHAVVSVLNATLDVVRSGSFPPWDVLAGLIRTMDGSSLSDWIDYPFDPKIASGIESRGVTGEEALLMYRSIREILVDAAALNEAKADAGSEVAQKLAARWWAQIFSLTDGSKESIAAFNAVNSHPETWPEADRTLFEQANPFLEAALAVYIEQNGIEVPESFLEAET